MAQSEERVLSAGTRVSHYEIERVLGKGGMGIVYRAVDVELDRTVALKCIRPDRTADPVNRERLHREARSASKLSHPNIVTVYDVLEHEGDPVIVMELIDGSDLRELLDEKGPPTLDLLLTWAEGLTEALAAAHAKRVLHRDIKPSNVVVDRAGRALLMDFGLAGRFSVGDEDESSMTTVTELEGKLIGTPGYISPEQLLGKAPDPRSDIFALGLVLYELCTGRRAFSGSYGEITDATLNREPTSIARLNYDIPEELERIVRKALAKRPDERYQSATEMVVDLRALRRRSQSGLDHPTIVVPAATRSRTRRRVTIGLTILALALAASAFALRDAFGVGGSDALPGFIPRQLTNDPGLEHQPALSPDGNSIAYMAEIDGQQEIVVSDVNAGGRLNVSDHPADDYDPAWFPDGSRIAFVSERSGYPAVWSAARLGGTPLLLLADARMPAISRDGSSIAFVRQDASGADRIFVAALDGLAAARQLTDDAGGAFDHSRPAWSPDGKAICYDNTFDDLWRVELADGKARALTSGANRDQRPVWSPDGRFIYYSSLAEGTSALWRVRADGRGEPERLTQGTGSEASPTVSRDGRRLAYATTVERSELMLFDRESGTRRTLSSLSGSHNPVTSGDQVLFLAAQDQHYDIWSLSIAAAGDPTPRRRTDLASGIGTFSLSPDGSYIAYHRKIDEQRDIWIGPAEGGVLTHLTELPTADLHPAWSHDGDKIAFVSERSGERELWVVPVEGGRAAGDPRRLTDAEGVERFPDWSPTDDRIAFIRRLEGRADVWVIAADGGAAATRVTDDVAARLVHWLDDETLLVSGTWDEGVELRSVDLDSGLSVPVDPRVDFGPSANALGDFTVSDDGRQIVYVRESFTGDIWMMEAAKGSF